MRTVSASERQHLRAEVRDILQFRRAAHRLRELTTKHELTMKVEWGLARVQPPDPRHLVITDLKIVEGVAPLVIENLATRLRPFMLPRERCSFSRIVEILPRHAQFGGVPEGTFEELAARWYSTLNATTAPIPAGTKWTNIIPGFAGKTPSEGRMTLMVDNEVLTGREVIELLLYGELVHVNRPKEKKLIRIRESDVAPGFQLAVVSIAGELARSIDTLRIFADLFVGNLPADVVQRIESEA
jgi:hypothetical protein